MIYKLRDSCYITPPISKLFWKLTVQTIFFEVALRFLFAVCLVTGFSSVVSNKPFTLSAAVLSLYARRLGLSHGGRLHPGCTRSNGQVPVSFHSRARREIQMRPKPNHLFLGSI